MSPVRALLDVEGFFRYTLTMSTLRTALAATAITLAITAPASADYQSDEALYGLSKHAIAATTKLNNCTGSVACVNAAAEVVRSDTKILRHLTKRINAGTIRQGTACSRAALRLKDSGSGTPWAIGKAWITKGTATKAAMVGAQIHYLTSVVAIYKAC